VRERSGAGRLCLVTDFEISVLRATPETLAQLTEILIEVVASGGSVSFMHPLDAGAAGAYWEDALAAADRDERVVFGAWEGDVLAGTVTLLLHMPPNQPHRAEVAKLMTRPSHRGRGIATALVGAAETVAVELGRTLLVLDTAAEGGAARLYARLGFTLSGEIPDYALKPHGGLTSTLIFWKRIGPRGLLDLS
jgi:ribosomal protein S18 acetylase RimI-like enzyme